VGERGSHRGAINRTQDASISVAAGPSTVYSLQKERRTRRKHHWGRLGDLRDLYAPRLRALGEPVDLVVECWSSDSEIDREQAYHEELTDVHRPDVALLPIGDHHTMGPEEAAFAAGLLGARHVIPMHYGLPGTTGTPAALRDAVARLGLRGVEVLEMTPGQTIAAPSR